jgi:hypothetical protein
LIRSGKPIVPPLTRLVTAVTVASSAPLSHIDHNLFESKKNAADANGYLVATKSGLATVSSPMNLANLV